VQATAHSRAAPVGGVPRAGAHGLAEQPLDEVADDVAQALAAPDRAERRDADEPDGLRRARVGRDRPVAAVQGQAGEADGDAPVAFEQMAADGPQQVVRRRRRVGRGRLGELGAPFDVGELLVQRAGSSFASSRASVPEMSCATRTPIVR
jgi:hypothetical protein